MSLYVFVAIDPSSLLDSKIEHSPQSPGSHVAPPMPPRLGVDLTPEIHHTPQVITTTAKEFIPMKSTSVPSPGDNSLPEMTTTGPELEVGGTEKPRDQDKQASPASDKKASKEDKESKSPDSHKKKNKTCGPYGCDGSGVVAVVVVAAVCTAIIIVVGAVLLKKVVDDRRRKKFRNVDYLINGMYT